MSIFTNITNMHLDYDRLSAFSINVFAALGGSAAIHTEDVHRTKEGLHVMTTVSVSL